MLIADPGYRVDVNATKTAAMLHPFIRVVVCRSDLLAAELALDMELARAVAASSTKAVTIVDRHSPATSGAPQ